MEGGKNILSKMLSWQIIWIKLSDNDYKSAKYNLDYKGQIYKLPK